MKFCVSTDVGTWTNWSTFEPDPDYSPDAGTGKYEIESRSNRHLTQSRLQVTGCTVEKYCLFHVVVQGPGSFRGLVNFFVPRTVAELRGVKVTQLSDFGLFSNTKPLKPSGDQATAQGLHRRMIPIFPCGSRRSNKGCLPAPEIACDFW